MFETLRKQRAPFALGLLSVFLVILFPVRIVHADGPPAVAIEQSTPLTDASLDAAAEQAIRQAAEQLEARSKNPALHPAKVDAHVADSLQDHLPDHLDADKLSQQAQSVEGLGASAPPGGESKPSGLPTGADKTGVSSQAISVPQGTGKIQGMGESFSAQLSTGIATFSVPFALPPARGAAQPSLGLSYSSSGGHGLAGLGWDMGVPYIARQTDRGLPHYDDQSDWHPNQDRFVFNGGQELVPICKVAGAACEGGACQRP